MNLIKRITLAYLLLPFGAMAQDKGGELVYFVGGNVKQATLEEPASYKLALSDLAAAPYIQMTYKNHDYAITSYTVSIMSRKFAKVVGQLKQQQGSIVESAAKMDYTLSTGDRIFIEDLGAFCGKCTGDKNIATKGMVILIE